MNPSTDADPVSPAPADGANGSDLSGRTLGDYRIERRLGQGGMGSVYLAQQLSLKRRVALKILRADLAANALSLQRFKAEAEAVAKVTHPHIVQVYASGDIDGFSYIALEYVEGRNLKEFVSKKGPPEMLLAVSFMRQIASALQRGLAIPAVSEFDSPTGKGAVGVVEGKRVVLGQDAFLSGLSVELYVLFNPPSAIYLELGLAGIQIGVRVI